MRAGQGGALWTLGLALALAGAGASSGQQEASVELDLDAFADHLSDALALQGVSAWEERLDPAAEAAWLGGRDLPGEPGSAPVEDMDGPDRRVAATVGLTVRAGDLVITRLVAPDLARARAIAARLLEGHAAPLGSGPTGGRLPRLPALLSTRGAQLVLVRGAAALELERALGARAAAWEAAGLPANEGAEVGPEALAVVDDGLEALACVGVDGAVRARLAGFVGAPPEVSLAAASADAASSVQVDLRPAGGAGLRARPERAAQAATLARGLAQAVGISTDVGLDTSR